MKNYIEGELINTLDEVVEQEFIFCRGKLYHKGWFLSWQVNVLLSLVRGGHIRKAARRTIPDKERKDDV